MSPDLCSDYTCSSLEDKDEERGDSDNRILK